MAGVYTQPRYFSNIEVQLVEEEVRKLLKLAEKHAGEFPPQYDKPLDPDKVTLLYRDSSEEYFKNIYEEKKPVIKPKLITGGIINKLCPVRGKIKGSFFGVTRFKKKLPDISLYGNKRVTVPLSKVFAAETKLYFADFHCSPKNPKNHYVLLVLTKSGTEADEICENKLVKLDSFNNKFLWKTRDTERAAFRNVRKAGLGVFVICTEDVNIKGRKVTDVTKRDIKTKFLTKNYDCRICNIERENSTPAVKARKRKGSQQEDDKAKKQRREN